MTSEIVESKTCKHTAKKRLYFNNYASKTRKYGSSSYQTLVAPTSIVTVMAVVVVAIVAVTVMTVMAIVVMTVVASMVTASVVSASMSTGELFGGLWNQKKESVICKCC